MNKMLIVYTMLIIMSAFFVRSSSINIGEGLSEGYLNTKFVNIENEYWVNETYEIGNQTFAQQGVDEDVELRLQTDVNERSYLIFEEGDGNILGFKIWYDGHGGGALKIDAMDGVGGVITPKMEIDRGDNDIDFFVNEDLNDNNITNAQCIELNNKIICSWNEINLTVQNFSILRNGTDANFGELNISYLEINQIQDDRGIMIYGHDDQAAEFLNISIGLTGNSWIHGSETIWMVVAGLAKAAFSTTKNYFYQPLDFPLDSASRIEFGTDTDFSIGYNEPTDSFRVVRAADLNADEWVMLDVNKNGDLNVSGNTNIFGNLSYENPHLTGFDNTTQNFYTLETAQVMNLSNDNYMSHQIEIVDNQNLTFSRVGHYQICISPEFYQASGNDKWITFWLQENGVDVPWSNSRYTMDNNEYTAPHICWETIIDTPATDNVRVMWLSDSTDSQIISIDGLTNPIRPGIPGIIMDVKWISNGE